MKVKVTSKYHHAAWYKMGEVYEVTPLIEADRWLLAEGRGGKSALILKADCEEVAEELVSDYDYKVVRHGDIGYLVPEWVSYLARNSTQEEVRGYEYPPTWVMEDAKWKATKGRVSKAHPRYVKPAGNFLAKV